jgi:hypothetical protein
MGKNFSASDGRAAAAGREQIYGGGGEQALRPNQGRDPLDQNETDGGEQRIGELRVTQAQLAGLLHRAVRLHRDLRGSGGTQVRELVKNGSVLPEGEQQPQPDWDEDLTHSCSAARSNTLRGSGA